MKSRQFIKGHEQGRRKMGTGTLIVAVVFVFILSGISWSLGNPNVRNPVGLGTSPVGGYRPGLFSSPSQFGTSGNDIITGNVRGGRYFHGPVPYQSGSSIRTLDPSASLSSFLRYSAEMEDVGSSGGKYRQSQPYYNPNRTVTFIRPDSSTVITPAIAEAIGRVPAATGNGAVGSFERAAQPNRQFFAGSTSTFDIRSWPMSRTLWEMERLISAEVGEYAEGGGLTTEPAPDDQRSGLTGAEQEKTDSRSGVSYSSALIGVQSAQGGWVSDEAADLKIGPVGQSDASGLSTKTELGEAVPAFSGTGGLAQMPSESASGTSEAPFPRYTDKTGAVRDAASLESIALQELTKWQRGQPQLKADVGVSSLQEKEQRDVYEQVKQRLDNLQKSLEGIRDAKYRVAEPGQLSAAKDVKETMSAIKGVLESTEPSDNEKKISEEYPYFEILRKKRAQESSLKRSSVSDELSGANISARANRVLGQYENLASFSQDKYNYHIRAAEMYLKQGRYYRAVNAYTLASIYKPDEPLAYAGKSHTLFAAGEYISSALFLSRALEMSPEYAQVKNDLVAILGGKDKLDSRIADVEEWLGRSGDAELQFLLGYVYYQIGSLVQAKEAIDAAYEKMPQSPAVGAVKKAIDDAMGQPGTKEK